MAAPDAGSPASFFISYAREDQAFVRRLYRALTARGRTVWVDWEAVPALAEWLPEVTAAIEAADVFVFVISPESAASEVCATEIGVAAAAHKRFAPLTLNEVEGALLPAAVRAPNWIFMRPSLDDFETGVASLVTAADTDFAWLRLHTRLQVRAREWEDASRDESLLARGRAGSRRGWRPPTRARGPGGGCAGAARRSRCRPRSPGWRRRSRSRPATAA